jgi:hypothetical protein
VFADIWPSKIDENGVLMVMLMFTALILAVVGIGIFFFARWSKREKSKRERDVNTAESLKG